MLGRIISFSENFGKTSISYDVFYMVKTIFFIQKFRNIQALLLTRIYTGKFIITEMHKCRYETLNCNILKMNLRYLPEPI